MPRAGRFFASAAACLGLAASAAGSGSGQSVDFAGRVVDTWLGEPVPGAVIRLLDRARENGARIAGVSGEDGAFRISDLRPGPADVVVSRLGYVDLAQVLDIQGGQVIEIALIPKPVVLAGIEVYADRLQARLDRLPFVTRTYLETELGLSPELSVAEFLHSQPGVSFVPCFEGTRSNAFSQPLNCVRNRGAAVQPRIFIDDAPAFGGVSELATLPTTEIYRVEFIQGCAQIRVYTNSYVEGTVTRRRVLLPVIC